MKEIICKGGEKVKVDDDMYEVLNQFVWRMNKGGYAYHSLPGRDGTWGLSVAMHHCVIGRSLYTLVTDHINRDKGDNQRANLRHVTPSENAINRKFFDGKPPKTCKAREVRPYFGCASAVGVHYGEIFPPVSFEDRAKGLQAMEDALK